MSLSLFGRPKIRLMVTMMIFNSSYIVQLHSWILNFQSDLIRMFILLYFEEKKQIKLKSLGEM